jgi:hypothetical protein
LAGPPIARSDLQPGRFQNLAYGFTIGFKIPRQLDLITIQQELFMQNPPTRPQPPQSPSLEIPEDLDINYVNLVRIAHSPSELVFDFAHLLPGGAPAKVKARVVMSPLGAKLLYRALAENLARFEAAFGEIKIPGDASLAEQLFKPPQPPPANPTKE